MIAVKNLWFNEHADLSPLEWYFALIAAQDFADKEYCKNLTRAEYKKQHGEPLPPRYFEQQDFDLMKEAKARL